MSPRRHLAHPDLLRLRTHRPLDHRVRHYSIDSQALGVRKSFYVALPPGYASVANRELRYPVLYLFRGHEREWVHRRQDQSRRGLTVVDVYRDLLSRGAVGPLILVFPGTSSDDHKIPGLLVNFRAPELVHGAPGIGSGRFQDYFLDELVPFVDRRFRTSAHRTGRAVDGFSLGGYQAIKIAAQRPDLFCSAGSFDGTFLFATYMGRSVRENDRVLRNPLFNAAFGVPRDYSFVASNNAPNLIWRGVHSELAQVQWLIRSGPESGEPWQSNYYRAQHLIGVLRARKLANGVADVLSGARHNWYWADRHIAGTLPLHWATMSPPLVTIRESGVVSAHQS